MAGILWK